MHHPFHHREQHIIASIAEDIFRSLPTGSRLSLLAFGQDYQNCDRSDGDSYCVFNGRTIFFNDRTQASKAVKIKASEARYLESESDLLDYMVECGTTD